LQDDKYKFLIDNQRKIEELAQRLASYAKRIDKDNINHFLTQFDAEHMGIGLKLIDNVDYYDGTRRLGLIDDICGMILKLTSKSLENVVFCPLKQFSGDSSDQVHRLFHRHMRNKVKDCRDYNAKFIHLSDLPGFKKKKTTVFFVDDFIGSGQSVVEQWGTMQHYENRKKHKYYFAVLVAYKEAVEQICKETFNHFEILTANELSDKDRIFSDKSIMFTAEEKEILKKYCKKVSNSDMHRYGHNNTQSLVVFQDGAPNNVIPILTQNTNGWYPLFPRHY
jgi:hypothetical protein